MKRSEKIKKILFVIPPGFKKEIWGKLTCFAPSLPSLGLAYIASSLRAVGHNVKILDLEITGRKVDDLYKEICDFKPDIIGMSVNVYNLQRSVKTSEFIKSKFNEIKIMFGGPYPTLQPYEIMSNKCVDFAVIGEGEKTVRMLLNALEGKLSLKDVSGLVYRNGDEIVENKAQLLIDNLDSLPYPSFDLFPLSLYYPASHIKGRKVINLITSRGCLYNCSFCAARLIFGKTFRFHSTERIISEINYLFTKYNYKSYIFYDDIFTNDRKRVLEFCDLIIQDKKKIQWTCFSRVDCLDEEMLYEMKKAGCYLISFGIESGNSELLKLLNKELNLEEVNKALSLVKKIGISTIASFMIGLPTETVGQTKKSIEFALKSELDYIHFRIFEPYPGTSIENLALSEGCYIKNHNSPLKKTWVPYNRNRKELESFVFKAFIKFYFRPKQMFLNFFNLLFFPKRRILNFFRGGLDILLNLN